MTIRVLLVDDHAMLREGLRAVLDQKPDIEVVGEAGNGFEALTSIAECAPRVVVMDIGMRDMNGIDATRRIKALYPNIKVVGLSTYSDRRYVLEMLDAGALGYVIKETAAEELCRAIRAAAQNRRYLSKDIADAVVDNHAGQRGPDATVAELSLRERQVLQLLSEGRSSPMIAERLNISVRTVDAHRRNIMLKLNLYTVAELTKYAVRAGLTVDYQ